MSYQEFEENEDGVDHEISIDGQGDTWIRFRIEIEGVLDGVVVIDGTDYVDLCAAQKTLKIGSILDIFSTLYAEAILRNNQEEEPATDVSEPWAAEFAWEPPDEYGEYED